MNVDQNEDDWLNVDASGEDGTGPALAALLHKIADTLEDAPDDARYDFVLEVDEQ